MDSYLVDEKRKLHVCGNNPDCPGYEVETGRFKLKGYEGPLIDCDKCGAEMQLKTGRFGKYFGCTASDCRNTRKLLRNGAAGAAEDADPVPMPDLKCEKVDDFYVLRDGASGLFLAASQFPEEPRDARAAGRGTAVGARPARSQVRLPARLRRCATTPAIRCRSATAARCAAST